MRAHPPLAPSFWDAEPFREVSLGHPRRDPSLDQRHRQPPQGAQSPLSDPTRAQVLIARELCAQLIALTRDRIPGRLDDPGSNVRAGVGRRARRKRLLEAPELRSRDPILTFVGDHRALDIAIYEDTTPMLGWWVESADRAALTATLNTRVDPVACSRALRHDHTRSYAYTDRLTRSRRTRKGDADVEHDNARIARTKALKITQKPTPGLEPGTPSLRVVLDGIRRGSVRFGIPRSIAGFPSAAFGTIRLGC
jgi:hypothetical protein